MSDEREESSKINGGLIGAAIGVFILVTMSFFYVFNISQVDSTISIIMSVISGIIVVWIMLSISGILKEFSIKAGPFLELKTRLEDVRKEARESNKEVCGKITNLNQNIQAINNRIDSVITNQMNVTMNPQFNLFNNFKELRETDEKVQEKVLESGISELLKERKFDTTKSIDVSDELRQQLVSLIKKEERLYKKIEQTLDGFPMDTVKVLRNASIYYHSKNYEKSIELLDLIIKQNPKDTDALFNKALSLNQLKKYKEAKDCYEECLKIDEQGIAYLNNLGNVEKELGNFEKALQLYEKILQMQPKNAKARVNKASILITTRGNLDEALKLLDEAIKFEPKNATAFYNRACAYSLKEDKNEALKHLEKAIKLDSSYKEIAQEDNDFEIMKNDPKFKKLAS